MVKITTMNSDRSDRMLGESSSFLEVQEHVSRAAPLDKPLLIVGERGTGKELIAARVHYLSERWGQPYLKVNCAAISDSLLETELFGHEQGAFSGATKQHKGLFERADGGTLFLDELATTSMGVQEKILRVIEYGELTRLGGNEVIEVDVRIVAATNGDLPSMAAEDKFRSDLLDRLAFDVITLPPLRERQEDIMLLAEFFALGMIKELKREYFPGFAEEAVAELKNYPWPGNVRELKNVVERAVYRSAEVDSPIDEIVFDPFDSPYRPLSEKINASVRRNDELLESDNKVTAAPNAVESSEEVSKNQDGSLGDLLGSDGDFKQYIQSLEQKIIQQAYRKCQHNQRKTAEMLGLTYHQLRGYLRKYNLSEKAPK